jgi:hypothetical protein
MSWLRTYYDHRTGCSQELFGYDLVVNKAFTIRLVVLAIMVLNGISHGIDSQVAMQATQNPIPAGFGLFSIVISFGWGILGVYVALNLAWRRRSYKPREKWALPDWKKPFWAGPVQFWHFAPFFFGAFMLPSFLARLLAHRQVFFEPIFIAASLGLWLGVRHWIKVHRAQLVEPETP